MQAYVKVCNKMKQTNKKYHRARKNIIDGRKHFIRHIQKTGENNLHELWVNNYKYNEGTSYLFSKWVNWCQGDGFSSGDT